MFVHDEKMARKKTAEHCGNMLGHLNLGEGNMFDRNDTKISLKDLPKDNHIGAFRFYGRPLHHQLQLSTITDATTIAVVAE